MSHHGEYNSTRPLLLPRDGRDPSARDKKIWTEITKIHCFVHFSAITESHYKKQWLLLLSKQHTETTAVSWNFTTQLCCRTSELLHPPREEYKEFSNPPLHCWTSEYCCFTSTALCDSPCKSMLPVRNHKLRKTQEESQTAVRDQAAKASDTWDCSNSHWVNVGLQQLMILTNDRSPLSPPGSQWQCTFRQSSQFPHQSLRFLVIAWRQRSLITWVFTLRQSYTCPCPLQILRGILSHEY